MNHYHSSGPAFPMALENNGNKPVPGFQDEQIKPGMKSVYPGVSLRDYFAAKAMAALIGERRGTNQEVAQDAYAFADAMLSERAT